MTSENTDTTASNGPQRYEYRILDHGRNNQVGIVTFESKLNEMAADGWRVIETFTLSGGNTAVILERPVQHGEADD